MIKWRARTLIKHELVQALLEPVTAGACMLCAVGVFCAILVWVGVPYEGRETPKLTADVVIPGEGGRVILIDRAIGPYEEWWSLPGGAVEVGETVEHAAVREVREETGLYVELVRRIGVYSDPDRDPRGDFVSVAYLARPVSGELTPEDDEVIKVAYIDPQTLERVAFDHRKIIGDALAKRARRTGGSGSAKN